MQDLFKSRIVLGGRFSLIFFILLISISSLVIAAPPFVQTSDTTSGLDIAYPKNEYFNVNDDIKLHFHVFNSSGFILPQEKVSCFVHVYGMTNNHLIERNTSLDSNGVDVFILVEQNELEGVGNYPYIVQCVGGGEGGFVSTEFRVSVDGKDDSFNGILKLFLVFLGGMILFIVGRVFKDYTTGILGGLLTFILGIYIIINPIAGLANWLSFAIASIIFAWGAYIWIVGTLEAIDLR